MTTNKGAAAKKPRVTAPQKMGIPAHDSRPPRTPTTAGAHPASRSDSGHAFLPDPYDGGRAKARAGEPLAELLGEDFVTAATSAETSEAADEVQTEELGGPFTETTASEELATDDDPSNPEGSEREPFPTATRVPS